MNELALLEPLLVDGIGKSLKKTSDPLRHHLRARIYALLAGDVYCIEEISEALQVPRSTTVYHLMVLKRAGLIKGNVFGKPVLYHRPEVSFEEAVGKYLQRTKGKILGIVRENPGIRNKNLADALGLGESTVSFHTTRLIMYGALARNSGGYFITGSNGTKSPTALNPLPMQHS